MAAVLTRPPAPVGRKRRLEKSPIHSFALEHGIPVLTPTSLKDEAIQSEIASYGAEAAAVVAYGLIIPPELLKVFNYGWFNLHFSLLPRWRGAAPVQAAIAAQDKMTGISIFQIAAGLDTGKIALQEALPLDPDINAGTLLEQLANRGARHLTELFSALPTGIDLREQAGEISYAPQFTTADARIDWQQPASAIRARINAFNPRPGAWTTLDGGRLKIGKVEVVEENSSISLLPGQLQAIGKCIYVGSASTPLRLRLLTPSGKKEMPADAWWRGLRQENPYFQ